MYLKVRIKTKYIPSTAQLEQLFVLDYPSMFSGPLTNRVLLQTHARVKDSLPYRKTLLNVLIREDSYILLDSYTFYTYTNKKKNKKDVYF